MIYTVKKGDTLSAIAKAHYGKASKYMAIFEANRPMLKDPDKIYPGQALRIPPEPCRAEASPGRTEGGGCECGARPSSSSACGSRVGADGDADGGDDTEEEGLHGSRSLPGGLAPLIRSR